MLTEFDAATLLDARPQLYPQLVALEPVSRRSVTICVPATPDRWISVWSLVKTGFKDGDSYSLDFPLGHFTDYETYADSVAVEGWRGMDQLSAEELDYLLDQLPELMKSVAPAGEFDDVEPVTVARAYKPE